MQLFYWEMVPENTSRGVEKGHGKEREVASVYCGQLAVSSSEEEEEDLSQGYPEQQGSREFILQLYESLVNGFSQGVVSSLEP